MKQDGTIIVRYEDKIRVILSYTEWWGTGVVICLERGADLHMAQLMPLPLTVSCFSEIQIGFNFLVLAHPGSPGIRAVKRVIQREWKITNSTYYYIRTQKKH